MAGGAFSQLPTQSRLSVAEYHRLIDAGVLGTEHRVELLRGELVPRHPIGCEHSSVVTFLSALFIEQVGRNAIVRVHNPVVLNDSEPESDLSIVKYRQDFYRFGKPRAADTLLVIEVADTSVEKDRDLKGAIYAEAGIPEYWIVNLIDQVIEIYREPRANGSWGTTSVASRGGEVSPLAFPDLVLQVDDVLGPVDRRVQ